MFPDDPEKGSRILELEPGAEMDLAWEHSKFVSPKIGPGKYRIRAILVGEDTPTGDLVSDPVEISTDPK
jgi:hypothetical protein